LQGTLLTAGLQHLRGRTVTAVETGSPIGTSSGAPLAFETPSDVQRPLRAVLGGRLMF
jgi:hypothetical protein